MPDEARYIYPDHDTEESVEVDPGIYETRTIPAGIVVTGTFTLAPGWFADARRIRERRIREGE